MIALAKALLLIARYYRRITVAIESIERLYRLELATQGIVEPTPGLSDEIEITYGPKAPRDPASADEW